MEYRLLGSLVKRKIGYGIVQPGQSTGDGVDGVPIIKVNNIISGLKSVGGLDTTSHEISEKYSRTILRGGELIVSVVGTIGKTAIVPENFAGCNLVRAVALLDIEDKIISKWVKYYLDSPYGKDYISQNLNTTVQPTLNIKSLTNMPIPFYDTEYMEKTIDFLSEIDDKIALNNKINENLEQQAQALYHEWFECVDRNSLPSGWKITTLDEIAEISKRVFNPAKEQETMLEHYSIPAFDERKFPVFEISSQIKSNKYIVDNSCLLISKLNPTIKRVWKPYCLTNNAVCSTEFIVYRAKDKELTDFLYSVIDSATFSDFMCSHVTGSTGSRQRTTPTDTLAFEFVLPKISDIQNFQHIVSPMYKQMKNNAVESQKLMQLRDSLLPKLMNGVKY